MAVTRATVILHRESGIELDAIRNVWHFSHPAALDDNGAIILTVALTEFYVDVSRYFGGPIDRVPERHNIQFANLTQGATSGDKPVLSKVLFDKVFPPATTPLTAVQGETFPCEVAMALSFRGDITGVAEQQGTTRPAARRRGRIFLGPLNAATMMTGRADGESYISQACIDQVLLSYETLVENINSVIPAFKHIVYSPTGQLTYEIVEASMDNAYDTIRSRGNAPLARTTKPITQGAA